MDTKTGKQFPAVFPLLFPFPATKLSQEPTPVDSVFPLVILGPNSTVDKWTVVRVLGQGAFGAVYEVRRAEPGKASYALKVESSQSKVHVLKMEVVVLNALAKSRAGHACELVDTGKSRGFFYIVMTLVGRSLGVFVYLFRVPQRRGSGPSEELQGEPVHGGLCHLRQYAVPRSRPGAAQRRLPAPGPEAV